MKKIFFASIGLLALATMQQANAADLARKAPILKAPPPPIWSWTGFYIGANVGYSWGRSRTDLSVFNNTTGALLFASSSRFDLNGAIGGGQIGYNWQSANWVWGIEADIQASGQDGHTLFICPGLVCLPGNTAVLPGTAGVSLSIAQKLEWFGTVRARLGWLVTPTVLAYVTGGLAYGGVKTTGLINSFNAGAGAVSAGFSGSDTNAGGTIGGGLEAHLSGNWTGKIEYLYIDLGRFTTGGFNTLSFPPLRVAVTSRVTDNIIRVGLNYRWDQAIIARF